MTASTKTTAARALGRHLVRIMPPSRADWAAGMKAEIEAIDDPHAALAFALGCVGVGYARRLRTIESVLVVLRGSVALLTLAFAALVFGNAGLALTLERPDTLPYVLSGLGLAYGIAGVTLVRRGPLALAGVAIIMLGLNTFGLWAIDHETVLYGALLRALVMEGYLLWSLLLATGVSLHHAGRSTRLAAFARDHGWNG